MNRSIKLALFCTCFSTVFAKNDTIIHGWHSEPHERGTWSIIWSCLATIFICTWSVLHMNVPPRGPDDWKDEVKRVYTKVSQTLLAGVAPEYILAEAFYSDFHSRRLKHDLNTRPKAAEVEEWTLTHTRFALAHGFVFYDGSTWNWDPLEELNDISMIPQKPPISKKELKSRAKSDWTTKTLALFQILWFAVQLLVRAIQHLHITALEILTLAFLICSLATYGLYWTKPQNVQYPVLLLIDPPNESSLREDPPIGDLTGAESPGEEPQTKRANRDVGGSETAAEAFKNTQAGDSSANGRRDLEKNIQITTHRSGTENNFESMIEALDKGHRSIETSLQRVSITSNLLLGFAGTAFGAIHCLAWNSTFPTPEERLAWRICCVATTSLPMFGALYSILDNFVVVDILFNPVFTFWVGYYAVARITIVVLALMALRALSADDLQTTSWNNLIPHIGV